MTQRSLEVRLCLVPMLVVNLTGAMEAPGQATPRGPVSSASKEGAAGRDKADPARGSLKASQPAVEKGFS